MLAVNERYLVKLTFKTYLIHFCRYEIDYKTVFSPTNLLKEGKPIHFLMIYDILLSITVLSEKIIFSINEHRKPLSFSGWFIKFGLYSFIICTFPTRLRYLKSAIKYERFLIIINNIFS